MIGAFFTQMEMKQYETKNRSNIHWAVPWSLVILAEICWKFTHGVNLGDHKSSNEHWLMHTDGDMAIQPQRHDVVKPTGELMGQPDPATLVLLVPVPKNWSPVPKQLISNLWQSMLKLRYSVQAKAEAIDFSGVHSKLNVSSPSFKSLDPPGS